MVSSLVFLQLVAVAFFTVCQAGGGGGKHHGGNNNNPLDKIKNLVTFGDSFTDTVAVSNGGTQWPTYLAGYTGAKLYPYARSGATCSNNLTFRPFPSLFESQLPTYYTDSSRSGTVHLDVKNTLFTLWIGTNDLSALLLGQGTGDASLVDVSQCMVDWVRDLYSHGARNFLFQNIVPLEKIPLFAPNSWPNRYWNQDRNTQEWSTFMRELVLSGNELVDEKLTDLAEDLKGAKIGIFDSHALFNDIYFNPGTYLNGTAPYQVNDPISKCVFVLNSPQFTCTEATGTDRDSYLWYDELHPSEQADRIVAREIADVVKGKKNRWTTWL